MDERSCGADDRAEGHGFRTAGHANWTPAHAPTAGRTIAFFPAGAHGATRNQEQGELHMTNAVLESNAADAKQTKVGERSRRLAERLEQGARSLADFARGLTAAQWNVAVPGDGRSVGVVVHH